MSGQIIKGQFVTIGKILTTQGNKGGLRVLPLTDFPERFRKGDKVYLEWEGRLEKHMIASVRYHKQWVILGFEEVDDMSAAEKLKNALIKIEPEQVFELPEGYYYVFQLVGLPVYTEEGQLLGDVIDIFRTGGNDVYQILHPETRQEILIPAIKDCVKSIDINARKIIVKLLPGLVD